MKKSPSVMDSFVEVVEPRLVEQIWYTTSGLKDLWAILSAFVLHLFASNLWRISTVESSAEDCWCSPSGTARLA